MKYCFLVLLSILEVFAVCVADSYDVADIPAGQVYWNKALPNTPIPSVIKQLLNASLSLSTVGKRSASERATPLGALFATYQLAYQMEGTKTQIHNYLNTTLFFLEKDLQPGNKMTFKFTPTITTSLGEAPFISRREANSIPFTSAKFPDILKHFSLQPNSVEAESMKQTLSKCERPAVDGESKYCATSLESMVEFSMTTMGTHNIQVMLTNVYVDKKENINTNNSAENLKQQYTVTLSSRLKSKGLDDNLVVCHSLSYAYAVFYCHTIKGTKAYQVRMVGKDGTKVETVAVCHYDTTKWNPKHIAFQLLHVKPGTVPICHFLAQDSLLWTPKN